MDSFLENDFQKYYNRIVEIFQELGYPQDLIGQWTLPLRDAQTLMGVIQGSQPRHIMEVGTFVGVTTLLMAVMSPPETHIHTIDPNFPLKVEMESMRSRLYNVDTTIKAQELAFLAAQKLGVDNKITFHEGGFSTANTFASYNTSPSSRIPIIGPEVCKNHGPFDFIFIDGLHYEEDVFSDVSLSAEHLNSSGFMAVHDVLGRWGSNVRRGVFRFLEEHDDFHFSHSKLSNVFDSIGLLERSSMKRKEGHNSIDSDILNGSLFEEKLLSNLATILANNFSPDSVVQLGGSIDLLEKLIKIRKIETCSFIPLFQEAVDESSDIKIGDLQDILKSEKKYDLCLCLNVLDELSQESIDSLVQNCVDLSDTIILAASPPGEMGNYRPNNKPLAYWIRKFFEKGYLFSDVIRPLLEPHVDALFAESLQNSSYLMNLYLITREIKLENSKIDKDILKEIILSKERRIEDLQLQNLYQRCILKYEREKYVPIYEKYNDMLNENRALNEEMEIINIFNQRVISNSIKRAKEIINNLLSVIS